MTGYKFKNGKFVERTPEEAERLAKYFQEVDKPVSKPKAPKRTEPFVQVSMKQLDKLMQTRSVEFVGIFFILCHLNFRHRGAAFILPSDQLTEMGGFDLRTQQRALVFLEKVGLIVVQRTHKKPPVVRVL